MCVRLVQMVSGVTNSISLRKDKKAPRVKRTADDDAADDTLLSQTLLRKGRKIALESRLAAEPHVRCACVLARHLR